MSKAKKSTVTVSFCFDIKTKLNSKQIRDHIGNFLNQIQDETEVVFNSEDTEKCDNLQYETVVKDYL